MKQTAKAQLFFRELEKIYDHSDESQMAKVIALYRLLNFVVIDVTQAERLQFTTLFARIAFASQKYEITRKQQFFIHAFRKRAQQYLKASAEIDKAEQEKDYQLGIKVVAETISTLLEAEIPVALQEIIPHRLSFRFSPVKIKSFRKKVRVVALADEADAEQLLVRDEDYPLEEIRVQYGILDRNQNFNPTIAVIRQVFGFPVNLNLIDVEVDENNVYRPKAIVVEPDFLVDVSAVSECFRDSGTVPILFLSKKFLPFQTTIPIIIGNIANYFLDELMSNPDVTFQEIFPKVFRLNPLAFCVMDDIEIKEIMTSCQRHYMTLKTMVKRDFEKSDIQLSDCFLEPSFYSETYGLQGRLDVFYKNESGSQRSAIVELKSGKPWRANKHGISDNHYTQTLLYDLIIRSTFEYTLDPANYILYSKQETEQLRYAPVTKSQQYEALQARNHLVAIERMLANLGKYAQAGTLDIAGNRLFRKLSTARLPQVGGFQAKDIEQFEKVYSSMSVLERKYFIAFSGLIAREHLLAKTGIQGISNINGLAGLWLNTYQEKEENFDLLGGLLIAINNSQADDPIIVFDKTAQTNPLANFRKGDIAVLYPHEVDDATNKVNTVLHNQIFKCTIIAITSNQVSLRLRSKQFNTSIFEAYEYWNVEHDLLDSSYTAMYRGLFAFNQFDTPQKELLLTLRPPRQPNYKPIVTSDELTHEQQAIFQQAIQAQDYFLLWGPPGTGKTSMMLKHIVKYLLTHTDEQLLLLAYTNRAVDEICEAIEQIGVVGEQPIQQIYLRIGSRYATAEKFQRQLLNTKTARTRTRQELLDILKGHRVFVSTVSSMGSQPQLLTIKNFDRVIIDEASQILEPSLVGFLPYFKQFILIGDHQQLPAVVTQSVEESAVEDEDLQAVGLHNLRNSLFERLYKRCLENDWHWAYAQLSHQGRMHADIMEFPNTHFYRGTLQILPEEIRFREVQLQALQYQVEPNATPLLHLLSRHRNLFFSTASDYLSGNLKTNRHEAEKIAELVRAFQQLYDSNRMELTSQCIGIITPYRAQIAQIRRVLSKTGDDYSWLTIDTVERYQGGARDIILISLCTNATSQLESLVSLSDEGVDRKLNVALTRARKHLVVVGNAALLSRNRVYEQLMAHFSTD